MANEEKDRFGDKLREVEHAREDDYFARRDRELIKKMRDAGDPARCPKCGSPLQSQPGTSPACAQCPRP